MPKVTDNNNFLSLTAIGNMLKRVAGILMSARVMKTGATVALYSSDLNSLPKEEPEFILNAEETVQTSKLQNGKPLLPPSHPRKIDNAAALLMYWSVEIDI